MVEELVNSECIHPSFLTELVPPLELSVDLCHPHNSPILPVWSTTDVLQGLFAQSCSLVVTLATKNGTETPFSAGFPWHGC